MKTFKELYESSIDNQLKDAIIAYSAKGGPDAIKYPLSYEHIKTLTKQIKRNKKITAYRTFSKSDLEWNKMFEDGYTEIGNINLEAGLTSFTIDPKMINRFRGGNDNTIVIEIKMKEYVPLLNDSLYPEEQEILGNDVKWKVTEIDDTKQNWYIKGIQL